MGGRTRIPVVGKRTVAGAVDQIRLAVAGQIDQAGQVPIRCTSESRKQLVLGLPLPGGSRSVVPVEVESGAVPAEQEIKVLISVDIAQIGIGVEADIEPVLGLGFQVLRGRRRAGVGILLHVTAPAESHQ